MTVQLIVEYLEVCEKMGRLKRKQKEEGDLIAISYFEEAK